MAGKKEEKLIKYISALPAGTRVSVRNLAKDNGVSEGTAYKAIKTAEKLRLVETKLRSGTVRLKTAVPSEKKTVRLSQLTGNLGLVVLEGEEFTDTPVGTIILGDGSLEQFKKSILESNGDTLCIVGDRLDLLFCAASQGVNVIVTGGAQPGEALLAEAREHHACILSSQQDSYTVLNLLRTEMTEHSRMENSDAADKWMRIPPYLYYNDMVVDWYSSYEPIFKMSSKHAVVDDSLKICGTVDATEVIASSTYTKISSLYKAGESVYSVDVSTSMDEIARHMVSNEVSVAYVTRGGELCGIITANDVLRYYFMNSAAASSDQTHPTLETLNSDKNRSVYTAQLRETLSDSADTLMGVIRVAIKEFSFEHTAKNGIIVSGTFFASPVPPGEVMVSCERRRSAESGSIIDIEMYNEASNYANCMLILTENCGSDNGHYFKED